MLATVSLSVLMALSLLLVVLLTIAVSVLSGVTLSVVALGPPSALKSLLHVLLALMVISEEISKEEYLRLLNQLLPSVPMETVSPPVYTHFCESDHCIY